MKKNRNPDLLPLGVLVLSAAGCALRAGLYASAVDEKNLLIRNHPLALCLWLCTAAAAVVAFLAARQGYKVRHYAANFEASVPAALGHILAGSGILLTVLLSPAPGIGLVGRLWKITGLLCCPALYLAAFSRARGDRPFFGSYGMVSIFFAMHMIGSYQIWCADPQLQNYVFAFSGSLSLMLLGYHQAAFCVDAGSSFLLRFFGLMAAYFCLTALPAGAPVYLYGGCAVWALTGLSRPCPRRKEKAGDDYGPA